MSQVVSELRVNTVLLTLFLWLVECLALCRIIGFDRAMSLATKGANNLVFWRVGSGRWRRFKSATR